MKGQRSNFLHTRRWSRESACTVCIVSPRPFCKSVCNVFWFWKKRFFDKWNLIFPFLFWVWFHPKRQRSDQQRTRAEDIAHCFCWVLAILSSSINGTFFYEFAIRHGPATLWKTRTVYKCVSEEMLSFICVWMMIIIVGLQRGRGEGHHPYQYMYSFYFCDKPLAQPRAQPFPLTKN